MEEYRILKTGYKHLSFEVQSRFLLFFWQLEEWFESEQEAINYIKHMKTPIPKKEIIRYL